MTRTEFKELNTIRLERINREIVDKLKELKELHIECAEALGNDEYCSDKKQEELHSANECEAEIMWYEAHIDKYERRKK